MIKGFDDLKVKYDVSYEAIDGNKYTIHNIDAINEYEATCKAAHAVNGDRNFGYNFKARFVSF